MHHYCPFLLMAQGALLLLWLNPDSSHPVFAFGDFTVMVQRHTVDPPGIWGEVVETAVLLTSFWSVTLCKNERRYV